MRTAFVCAGTAMSVLVSPWHKGWRASKEEKLIGCCGEDCTIWLICHQQLKCSGLVLAEGWASQQPTMLTNSWLPVVWNSTPTPAYHNHPALSSSALSTLQHQAQPFRAAAIRPGVLLVLVLMNLFLNMDSSQRPPACLAFPASSDSASVGLQAAMRGRAVTVSSQHTPSSPPSPPSSSSHHRGSTGCCLSTDSYPPAATLNWDQQQPLCPHRVATSSASRTRHTKIMLKLAGMGDMVVTSRSLWICWRIWPCRYNFRIWESSFAGREM